MTDPQRDGALAGCETCPSEGRSRASGNVIVMSRSLRALWFAAAIGVLAVLVLACASFSHTASHAHAEVSPHAAAQAVRPHDGGNAPSSHDESSEQCTTSILSACLGSRAVASSIVLALLALLAGGLALLSPLVAARRRVEVLPPNPPAEDHPPLLALLCISRT